ncbi:MAG: DJ-1/PfpI family protein [Deltaproteobacteria bacterium]|nr:DJ-1/PfpI family protein [Deltaproteobacteria bacterium]MBW2415135.1 DJ-1/PfpI family protein [Deltaproteobacteria bacterium]
MSRERTIGILLFDDAEELDWAGPWEVLTSLRMVAGETRVVTIAERDGPVTCAKGLRVLPDHDFESAPPLDVVLVPGGQGTRRQVDNPALIEWLRRAGADAEWVTSVCTGALLLHEAGFARGKRVTTHWGFCDQLEARGDVTVLRRTRWVRDGNLVTAAGVSAGIDMALWLVGQMHSPGVARQVQRYMEYDPAPPYQAEV